MIDEILKERQTQHGDFRVNSSIAQSLKASIRKYLEWKNLTVVDKEAIDNILQKIARHISGGGGHEDTIDDIIGYATLMKKGGYIYDEVRESVSEENEDVYAEEDR